MAPGTQSAELDVIVVEIIALFVAVMSHTGLSTIEPAGWVQL